MEIFEALSRLKASDQTLVSTRSVTGASVQLVLERLVPFEFSHQLKQMFLFATRNIFLQASNNQERGAAEMLPLVGNRALPALFNEVQREGSRSLPLS